MLGILPTRQITAAIPLIVILALLSMLMLTAAAVAVQVENPFMRGSNQPSATARQVQEIGTQIMQSRAAGKRHTTLIFTGPNSTDKYQAAEALSRQLGRPVQRINLAALVSKYIGETENNLRQLLAKAESVDAILLFDEADALFGKRTTPTDAQDRYANLATSSLLQRIESYPGIIILTSNHPETPNKIRHDHAITFALTIKKLLR